MPTTFTGLLLFVVLLLPGFAYLVGKERAGTERRTSPFRETVSIVAASVASELAILIVSSAVWSQAVDLTGVVHRPRDHYATLAGWGVGLLLAATLLAYLWSLPDVRGWLARIVDEPKKKHWYRPNLSRLKWIIDPTYPHPSTVSAWWWIFEDRQKKIKKKYGAAAEIRLGCYLTDGSYVSGLLNSFNQSADDIADRDLVLVAPLERMSPGKTDTVPLHAHALCVSARQIALVTAKYYLPPLPESPVPVDEASDG